jgi:hypothetical protein
MKRMKVLIQTCLLQTSDIKRIKRNSGKAKASREYKN